MFLNPEKTLVIWNKDDLDTYHDVTVSFDYSRASEVELPDGGFCVVFFESREKVPTIGGPRDSLGYSPSNQSDYCFINGYNGFRGGLLGVGFDSSGNFGKKTTLVNGLEKPIPNSVNVRSSEINKYNYIASSINLINTPKNFIINEKVNDLSERKYKTVKILISKAFTELEVQIKKYEEEEFYTVLKTKIPIEKRTAIRVGITTTFTDNTTDFKIKNFNVAGFPGELLKLDVENCTQIDATFAILQGNGIVSDKNFVAVPVGGSVFIYDIIDGKFRVKQTIDEVGDVNLLGGNEKFLFVNVQNTYNIDVYFKLNTLFLKTQTIELSGEIPSIDLPDTSLNYPVEADTDGKTLVVGDKNNVYVFKYTTGLTNYGLFLYTQTITNHPSGNIGYSVQVDEGKILTGGGNKSRIGGDRYGSFVAFYENDGLGWNGDPKQTFESPVSGNPYNEFGYKIAMQGNEAVISAPNEFRRNFTTVGHGEVYHYIFTTRRGSSKREWRPAMELGSFYRLDTMGGNFGTSLSFLGNNLVVSAPYENYHYPPDFSYEKNPNAGKIYIFRKNSGGTFSQAAIVNPDPEKIIPNMYFGRYVGLYNDVGAIATVPYRDDLVQGDIGFFKIGCIFDLPPRHLDIPPESIALYDNSGYTIDIETFTNLTLINKFKVEDNE